MMANPANTSSALICEGAGMGPACRGVGRVSVPVDGQGGTRGESKRDSVGQRGVGGVGTAKGVDARWQIPLKISAHHSARNA